jgi:hypothetical protein
MSEKGLEAEGFVNEMKELVKLLRETLVELRGIADQLGNPIVPQVRPPSIKGKETIKEEAQEVNEEAGHEHMLIEGETSEKIGVGKNEVNYLKKGPVLLAQGSELKKIPTASATMKGREPIRLLRLAKLIYELSEKVPPEYFVKLAEFVGTLGLTDKEQVEALKALIEIVKMSNEYGLSLEESLALLVLILRELGVDDREMVDEVLKRVVRGQGAARWESQQQ